MLCLLISFFFLLSCINAWLFIYSNLNKFKTNMCVSRHINARGNKCNACDMKRNTRKVYIEIGYNRVST